MLKHKTELPIKMAQFLIKLKTAEKYHFQNYSFSFSQDIQFYSQSPVSVGQAWSF